MEIICIVAAVRVLDSVGSAVVNFGFKGNRRDGVGLSTPVER
jgi:hypothetical protein